MKSLVLLRLPAVVLKKKKIFLGIILIAIACLSVYAWREYNRSASDISAEKSILQLSATKLAQDFEINETNANTEYLGKIVTVSGIITAIEQTGDTLSTVVLGSKDAMHNVSCQLAKVNDAASLNIGDSVNIKGFITGLLMDVELNRCIVENK